MIVVGIERSHGDFVPDDRPGECIQYDNTWIYCQSRKGEYPRANNLIGSRVKAYKIRTADLADCLWMFGVTDMAGLVGLDVSPYSDDQGKRIAGFVPRPSRPAK